MKNDAEVIQFKIQQVPFLLPLFSLPGWTDSADETWKFRMLTQETSLGIPVTPTIDALVTLTLDPETVQSDSIRVKYHREQGSDENYNAELLGFTFKKWQADQISRLMDSPEVEAFRGDKRKVGDRYWTGRSRGTENGHHQ